MEVFRYHTSLPGHEDCGTILIVYNIQHGIQVRASPPPGTWPGHRSSAPLFPPTALSAPTPRIGVRMVPPGGVLGGWVLLSVRGGPPQEETSELMWSGQKSMASTVLGS